MPVPVDVIRFAFWMERVMNCRYYNDLRIAAGTAQAKCKITIQGIEISAYRPPLGFGFLHLGGELAQ